MNRFQSNNSGLIRRQCTLLTDHADDVLMLVRTCMCKQYGADWIKGVR